MIAFSPYPAGKSYAFTFVDDTDYSTRENTEPVYDLLASHGFMGTKTVWPLAATRNSAFRRDLEGPIPRRHTGATLQDPNYVSFIVKLQELGFEVALHGVAAGNSTRPEIEAGLAHYRKVLGRLPEMNVFHQTNIENLYCGEHKLDSPILRALERALHRSAYEGHRAGAPSFWGDLSSSTFRYVRLPFHTIDDVNTLRVNPSMPFHDETRPYVRQWFAASDGADVVRFNRLLSDTNVRRLARQQGTCVIYTHFANQFARKGGDGYTLDRDFVSTVKRVTADGRAWFATATALLDRLSAVRMLSLDHEGRQIRVKNHGDRAIDGAVLRVPENFRVQSDNGMPIEHTSNSIVLPAIGASQEIVLAANVAGQQRLQPRDAAVDWWERRRIEYGNYCGLVRSAMKDRWYYAGQRNG